jgi:hypothetical protein
VSKPKLDKVPHIDCSQHGVRMNGVVIDTNVFVAAGFNSKSAAARILVAVRAGQFLLVWNKPTRRETETILRRIPGLDWAGSRICSGQRVSLPVPSIPTLLS